jgi:hypothetical protein
MGIQVASSCSLHSAFQPAIFFRYDKARSQSRIFLFLDFGPAPGIMARSAWPGKTRRLEPSYGMGGSIMRRIFYASLAIVLLFTGGCGSARPMTEKEFNGFCYQNGDGGVAGCDTISVCNPYDAVIEAKQSSLRGCLDACENIHKPQVWQYINTDCLVAANSARDWCQRYCRTAYPQ